MKRKMWNQVHKQYMKTNQVSLHSSKKFRQMYDNDKTWNYVKVWANRFLFQIKKSNSHRKGITSFEYSNLRLFDKPNPRPWAAHYLKNDEQRINIEFLKFMCNMHTKRGAREV